ncbi:hypothetical protein ACFFGH_32080 [Lysobacter korlensis]|uniref:FHA domain-containing protein n=1 Tax=Lysobacter korlensis TaxID=553636 RepID=A0ABV6S300_9GAMM
MTEPDQQDTILRPDAMSVALDSPVPDDAAFFDPDDEHTVVRDPTAPAIAGSDEADDDEEDEPHPTEALRFRVSNGAAQVLLDEDVHIGRNPRPPRLDRGTPVRLLRVDSPTGVISSSHLGLRRVGSTAVAADLMSTNGTVVFLPGFPPRRLRQGESVVAPPGTRLEIGEGIVIEVIRPSALG